jgi:DHA1 family inner membrane transport protein
MSFIAVLVLYTQVAQFAVGLFVSVFLLGLTSSTLIPSIQTRLIRISDEAALLGAAVNHAAFNVGNSLGAWLGGVVIAGGLGYLAPGWVGAALGALGFALAMLSLAVERRDKARDLNTVGIPIRGD